MKIDVLVSKDNGWDIWKEENVAQREGKDAKSWPKSSILLLNTEESNKSTLIFRNNWAALTSVMHLMDVISIKMAHNMKSHRAIYETDCFWKGFEIYTDERLLLISHLFLSNLTSVSSFGSKATRSRSSMIIKTAYVHIVLLTTE